MFAAALALAVGAVFAATLTILTAAFAAALGFAAAVFAAGGAAAYFGVGAPGLEWRGGSGEGDGGAVAGG